MYKKGTRVRLFFGATGIVLGKRGDKYRVQVIKGAPMGQVFLCVVGHMSLED